MTVTGYVKKNVIIPDKPIKLRDGTKVNIVIPETKSKKPTGLCGIWEDSRSAEEIVEEIISARSMGREVDL